MQEYRNTRIREYMNTGMQEYSSPLRVSQFLPWRDMATRICASLGSRMKFKTLCPGI